MTNYAELIAEAEAFSGGWDEEQPKPRDIGAAMELIDRLAAALHECAVPEGWRVTEMTHVNRAMIIAGGSLNQVRRGDLHWSAYTADNICLGVFPTSREAMAVLDVEGK